VFSATAHIYDVLHADKDYAGECAALRAILRRDGSLGDLERPSLLDAGCAIGGHIGHLSEHHAVTGLEIDPSLVEQARARLPGTTIHWGDMADFAVDERFDVIVSLFGAIAYVGSRERLDATFACFEAHLAPSGMIAIEPWFSPERYPRGEVTARVARARDVTITRMARRDRVGARAMMDVQYLVCDLGRGGRIERLQEHHDLALFTDDDLVAAASSAGIELHRAVGFPGEHGLFVGRRRAVRVETR